MLMRQEPMWSGLVTVQEMATGLRVSVAQAYRKVKDLGIGIRIGKRILRVPLGKIAEALGEEAARAVQTASQSPASTPSSARSSRTRGIASSPGTSSASG